MMASKGSKINQQLDIFILFIILPFLRNTMQFQNNNIKTATAYQRDSTNRTASEKILDKHYNTNIKTLLKEQEFEAPVPIKKVKIQNRITEGQLTAGQIYEKIIKHLENQSKMFKSLELLQKFLLSENFDQIDAVRIMGLMKRLTAISDKTNIEHKIRNAIVSIFETIQTKQKFSEVQMQIFQIFKLGGVLKNNLYTDDSFQFNKSLNAFEKCIENFKIVKEKIELLQEYKELIKQEEIQSNQSQWLTTLENAENERILWKRQQVFKILSHLFSLGVVNWIKPSIEQFFKRFNFNHRDNLLSKSQKKEFTQIYQQFQNKKIKSDIINDKLNNVDKKIMSNPAICLNSVKDAKVTVLVEDGASKWVDKQNAN